MNIKTEIPTASVLIAFSKDAVNLLQHGIVTYNDLQQKLDELNKGNNLQAFLFGTEPDGNLLEFTHELAFSDNSQGIDTPSNQVFSGFKLRILDPRNIFEKFFIAYYGKLWNPEDILEYVKNREAASITTSSINTTRSEEHTSELQSQFHIVCRLLLEKKNT